ncbi:MAG: shikimate dehydrogenase [Betaproteobacteria bacterium]|nr:shikimate dehydrogenase [Betaproteobacteria bacterium]
MTDRYAVVGNPVAHSKSPMIHHAFAKQTGQDIAYERLLSPLDEFLRTVEGFRAIGGKGVNVTVPFKLEAYRLATIHSACAQLAQACNCLRFDSDAIFGDNTDGNGIVTDIQHNLSVPLRGQRILIMGAGGAVQGILGPVLDCAPAQVIVANRTEEKARRLVDYFLACPAYAASPIRSSSYAALKEAAFDIVVNGTSSSLSDTLPALPPGVFARRALAYDMMYGKGRTPFLAHAREQGGGILADGLGMLVEQAAESFLVWRGVRPATAPVIAMLKAP